MRHVSKDDLLQGSVEAPHIELKSAWFSAYDISQRMMWPQGVLSCLTRALKSGGLALEATQRMMCLKGALRSLTKTLTSVL